MEWPLQTVLDAWAAVVCRGSHDATVERGLQAAEKVLKSRLEELWASQPQDAFAQHLERYFQRKLDGKTEEQQLTGVLWQHCCRSFQQGKSHFSATRLVVKPRPPGVEWWCPGGTTGLARRLLAARGPVEAEAEAKRRRLEATSSTEELQAKAEERLRTELVEAQGEATFLRIILSFSQFLLLFFLTLTFTVTFAFALAPALAFAFGFTFSFNCAVAFAAVACMLFLF